jgi:two-component system alkaline phosphatase synthesis response regulator PhoP
MEKPRLLVVEDHAETRRFLEAMLSKDYEVISAENAVIGIDLARNRSPQVILMDVMLPILSGHDACSLLKKDERTKHIPVIFLSAKGTSSDVTQGLTQGADDYISKPFDYHELVARIQARLRQVPAGATQTLTIGELTVIPSTREVKFAGKAAKLTLTEFDILRLLAQKNGQVVSRDDIMNEIWPQGQKKSAHRTIDVHIRSLRKKIPAMTKHILSIYGAGYKYEI